MVGGGVAAIGGRVPTRLVSFDQRSGEGATLFDRFTEQARRVLVLAAGEARVGGRAALDTGDLLVALANEDTGVASAALADAGALATEVTTANREAARIASGEVDDGAMAPDAKAVLQAAAEQAIADGH